MGLRSTKSIPLLQAEASDAGAGTLRRSLGLVHLTALGIGGTVGAGVFVLTGAATANYAGPAIALSFVLAGLACLFAALCYAEFAATIPIAGSAYTYSYATLGEFVAWVVGWNLILEYLVGAAAVAVGWSGHVVELFATAGIRIPAAYSASPFNVADGSLERSQLCVDPVGKLARAVDAACTAPNSVVEGVVNLPAVLLILGLTLLLMAGMRGSARLNSVMVAVKVAVMLLVIAVGVLYVNRANWVPFVPPNTGVAGEFGLTGIARGAGVVFFAFLGFEAVTAAAQEARNPERDLPIAIVATMVIATGLYAVLALVMTGLAHYTTLDVPNPVDVAVTAAGPSGAWLATVVNVGAVAGLASVVLVLLMAQPRIFYAMARDGLLPRFMARVHPRFHTPWLTTLLSGAVAALVAGLLPIRMLAELVSIGTLFAFVVVCIAVLVLRYRRPNIARPFRVPVSPLVPGLGALACAYLMLLLPGSAWLRLAGWMAAGTLVYLAYGRGHSVIGRHERQSVAGDQGR